MRSLIFFLCTVMILNPASHGLAAETLEKERVFLFQERIVLKNLPKDARKLHIWVPYPKNDKWQSVDSFNVAGQFDMRFISDKKNINTVIYLTPKRDLSTGSSVELTLSFQVRRKECAASFFDASDKETLSRFLKADKLVPVNAKLKALARKITGGKNGKLEKVRAVYDYLIDELTYSKDDPKVCGIGDSLLTLRSKKGICADYHSLFISLVRSLGIPAKFEIGFRLPQDSNEGKLNSYHCWAKFYLKDRGWIPVDVSEADKHPEKKDYFFGNLDESRIHLTTGRDIRLFQAKNRKPLNFFVYPYVEFSGAQSADMDVEVTFKELKGGKGL